MNLKTSHGDYLHCFCDFLSDSDLFSVLLWRNEMPQVVFSSPQGQDCRQESLKKDLQLRSKPLNITKTKAKSCTHTRKADLGNKCFYGNVRHLVLL